jgi:hypothetical protein
MANVKTAATTATTTIQKLSTDELNIIRKIEKQMQEQSGA